MRRAASGRVLPVSSADYLAVSRLPAQTALLLCSLTLTFSIKARERSALALLPGASLTLGALGGAALWPLNQVLSPSDHSFSVPPCSHTVTSPGLGMFERRVFTDPSRPRIMNISRRQQISEVAPVVSGGHGHGCAAVCSLYSVISYSRAELRQSPGCPEARGKAAVMCRGLLAVAMETKVKILCSLLTNLTSVLPEQNSFVSRGLYVFTASRHHNVQPISWT